MSLLWKAFGRPAFLGIIPKASGGFFFYKWRNKRRNFLCKRTSFSWKIRGGILRFLGKTPLFCKSGSLPRRAVKEIFSARKFPWPTKKRSLFCSRLKGGGAPGEAAGFAEKGVCQRILQKNRNKIYAQAFKLQETPIPFKSRNKKLAARRKGTAEKQLYEKLFPKAFPPPLSLQKLILIFCAFMVD